MKGIITWNVFVGWFYNRTLFTYVTKFPFENIFIFPIDTKRDLNLGSKPPFLLEFERWWLRLLSTTAGSPFPRIFLLNFWGLVKWGPWTCGAKRYIGACKIYRYSLFGMCTYLHSYSSSSGLFRGRGTCTYQTWLYMYMNVVCACYVRLTTWNVPHVPLFHRP